MTHGSRRSARTTRSQARARFPSAGSRTALKEVGCSSNECPTASRCERSTGVQPPPMRMARPREYDDARMGEMGPLVPDDSPRAPRVWRRVRGIAAEVIALTLVTLLSPVLVICAVAVDVALWLRRRKPWMAVRLLAMLWWFLVGELYGLLGLFGIWVLSGGRDGPRRRARVYRLKRRWLISHLAGIRVLFG